VCGRAGYAALGLLAVLAVLAVLAGLALRASPPRTFALQKAGLEMPDRASIRACQRRFEGLVRILGAVWGASCSKFSKARPNRQLLSSLGMRWRQDLGQFKGSQTYTRLEWVSSRRDAQVRFIREENRILWRRLNQERLILPPLAVFRRPAHRRNDQGYCSSGLS